MAEQTFSYDEYLANLPADRRETVERVWQVVRDNIPQGYTEQIGSKFLSFTVDNELYVAMANGKNYISFHLMPIYVFPNLKARLDGSGKKLKGGKSCINFQRVEELPLEIIAEIVGCCDADAYKEQLRRMHHSEQSKRSG